MADEQQSSTEQPATGGTATEDPTFTPPTPTGQNGVSKDEGESDLGDAGKRALAAERQARKDLERQVKELSPLAQRAREAEDAQKSEVERLTERLSAAEQRAQSAELAGVRMQVAAMHGLTPEQANRLQGSTREELDEDAGQLKQLFAPADRAASERPAQRTPVEMLRPGAVPDADGSPADMNAWMRRKPPTTN